LHSQTALARITFVHSQAVDALSLLRRQLAVDSFDGQVAHSGKDAFFRRFPRWRLAGTPLAPSLKYACAYHPAVRAIYISAQPAQG
jgi:hypothetical protein